MVLRKLIYSATLFFLLGLSVFAEAQEGRNKNSPRIYNVMFQGKMKTFVIGNAKEAAALRTQIEILRQSSQGYGKSTLKALDVRIERFDAGFENIRAQQSDTQNSAKSGIQLAGRVQALAATDAVFRGTPKVIMGAAQASNVPVVAQVGKGYRTVETGARIVRDTIQQDRSKGETLGDVIKLSGKLVGSKTPGLAVNVFEARGQFDAGEHVEGIANTLTVAGKIATDNSPAGNVYGGASQIVSGSKLIYDDVSIFNEMGDQKQRLQSSADKQLVKDNELANQMLTRKDEVSNLKQFVELGNDQGVDELASQLDRDFDGLANQIDNDLIERRTKEFRSKVDREVVFAHVKSEPKESSLFFDESSTETGSAPSLEEQVVNLDDTIVYVDEAELDNHRFETQTPTQIATPDAQLGEVGVPEWESDLAAVESYVESNSQSVLQPTYSQPVEYASPQDRLLDSVRRSQTERRSPSRFLDNVGGGSIRNRLRSRLGNPQGGGIFGRRNAPLAWGGRNRSSIQDNVTYHYGQNRNRSGAGAFGNYRGSGPDGQRFRIISNLYGNSSSPRQNVDRRKRMMNLLSMAGVAASAYAGAAQQSAAASSRRSSSSSGGSSGPKARIVYGSDGISYATIIER